MCDKNTASNFSILGRMVLFKCAVFSCTDFRFLSLCTLKMWQRHRPKDWCLKKINLNIILHNVFIRIEKKNNGMENWIKCLFFSELHSFNFCFILTSNASSPFRLYNQSFCNTYLILIPIIATDPSASKHFPTHISVSLSIFTDNNKFQI